MDTFEKKGLEVLLHDSIYNTARRCAILPSRMNIVEVQTIPVSRVNGGGFADIYEGRLSDGQVVALKTPRCFGGPEEIKKILAVCTLYGIICPCLLSCSVGDLQRSARVALLGA